MKKSLLPRLISSILAVAFAGSMHAQQSDSAFTYKYHLPVNSKLSAANSHKSFLENSHFTEIKIKAVRHFLKYFQQAANVSWYKTDNGVVAYFTINDIKTRSAYDKKGNWLSSIRSYTDAHLPKNIRNLVKSMFYDFTIICVNEITNARQLIYIIQIEDETFLKTLQVYDGEMTITNEYVKKI